MTDLPWRLSGASGRSGLGVECLPGLMGLLRLGANLHRSLGYRRGGIV
jgi:hypothetical protein